MSIKEVVELWRSQVVRRAKELDEQNDKGGHDWHSLWTGLVIACGRGELTDWSSYMKYGFPEEK